MSKVESRTLKSSAPLSYGETEHEGRPPMLPQIDQRSAEETTGCLTAFLIHALPSSERRCLDRKEAASYIGVSVGTFDKLVRSGQMPSSVDLYSRKVWDRRALDTAIDARMAGSTFSTSRPARSPSLSPLDAWRSADG